MILAETRKLFFKSALVWNQMNINIKPTVTDTMHVQWCIIKRLGSAKCRFMLFTDRA